MAVLYSNFFSYISTASIGEMFYQLIWKESKNEIDVYNLEEDIRMEILDVNKKNANVLINGQETIALSQDNSLVRKELNMVGDCNLQFSTNSLEFVLLVIKFVKDNTFGEIKGETSQIYEFTNQYILFKLPQNKAIAFISIPLRHIARRIPLYITESKMKSSSFADKTFTFTLI